MPWPDFPWAHGRTTSRVLECISWKFAKGFIAEEFPNRKKLLIILGCCTLRSGWDIGLIGRFRSTYFFTMTIDIVQTYVRAVITLRA